VCTDDAAAMTGKKKGLLAHIKKLNNVPDVISSHFIIHREALTTKKIAPEINKVLEEAVTVVICISIQVLNSWLFSKLYKAMGSNHDKLLLRAEVGWLSRGGVLRRLVKLKEVKLFLMDENPTLADLFHNENWLCNLPNLTDISEKLIELNASLQGENANILLLHDKITTFIKKISIWKQKVANGSIYVFPRTNDFNEDNEFGLAVVKNVILSHLSTLVTQFEKYFPTNWDIENTVA
jgi:hypothetical protein